MKQTTIRLPEELHKQLKAEAKERGMTLNAYVISVLWRERNYHITTGERFRIST